jgi:hypothetical protein
VIYSTLKVALINALLSCGTKVPEVDVVCLVSQDWQACGLSNLMDLNMSVVCVWVFVGDVTAGA